MKRHLLSIPMILATSAAIADAQTTAPSVQADAQAQAAALLSPAHAIGVVKADTRPLSPSPASAPLDAHQSAAALLSGARSKNHVNAASAMAQSTDAGVSTDAHAQAAALLSGSRLSTSQTNRTDGGALAIGAGTQDSAERR
jgi:cell division septum initiation protein DivIVA